MSRLLLCLSVLASLLVVVLPAGPADAASYPPVISYVDRYNGPAASGIFQATPGSAGSEHIALPDSYSPAWSPTGEQLAFVTSNSDDSVYTIKIGDRYGKHAQKLISGSAFLNDPDELSGPLVWSPNGKQIAYMCDGTYEDYTAYIQLCTVDVATGKRHMITNAASFPGLVSSSTLDQRLSWSPDGDSIIGEVNRPDKCAPNATICASYAIASIDLDSGAATLLTDSQTVAYAPDLAPNGRSIVFYQYRTGLRTMNATGGHMHTIVKESELLGDSLSVQPFPVYSPDSSQVLFSKYVTGSNPGAGYEQLFTVDASGDGALKQLTRGAFAPQDAVWTPVLTTCTVPDLKGKTIAKAKTALQKAACKLGKVSGPRKHRPSRHIVTQSIKANTEKPAGTKVDVKLG